MNSDIVQTVQVPVFFLFQGNRGARTPSYEFTRLLRRGFCCACFVKINLAYNVGKKKDFVCRFVLAARGLEEDLAAFPTTFATQFVFIFNTCRLFMRHN